MKYFLLAAVMLTSFLTVLAVYVVLFAKRTFIQERLGRYPQDLDLEPKESDKPVLGTEGVTSVIDAILKSKIIQTRNLRIQNELDKARIQIKPTEYMILSALAMLVMGLFLALLTESLILGLLGLLLGYFLPGLFLEYSKRKIAQRINDQLPDVLAIISNGLRAGLSFSQSIIKSIKEIKEPLATDFRKLVHDTVLGKDLTEALDELAVRAGDEDIDMLVAAITIHRQVGGNLAEILDILAETVRERVKIKGDIRRLTVQSKMSAAIVGAIPILILMIMYALNRDFVMPLFTTLPGLLMLGVALGMQVIGIFIIIKIINTKI